MIMGWINHLTLLVIYSLLQPSCGKENTQSRRYHVGIIVGKPLITLAEAQVDKNGKAHLDQMAKPTRSVIKQEKLHKIAPVDKQNNALPNDSDRKLPFLNPKLLKDIEASRKAHNNLSNWLLTNVPNDGNETSGVKFGDEFFAPSTLAEKLYSELEGEEAKMAGFQVVKDPSGKEVLVGPMVAVPPTQHPFLSQNSSINASTNAATNDSSLEIKKQAKNTTLEEKLLNGRQAKVSYVLNKEAGHRNQEQQSPLIDETPPTNFGKLKEPPQGTEVNTDKSSQEQQSPLIDETLPTNFGTLKEPSQAIEINAVKSANKSGYHNLPEVNGNASDNLNTSGVKNAGSVKISPNNQGRHFLTGPKNITASAPTISQQDNLSKGSNIQLSQLIKSVMNLLGNNGSEFVSTELAKHPSVKKVWATAIAHALMKQSTKMTRLDSKQKTNNDTAPPNPSSIEGNSSRQMTSGDKLLKEQVNGTAVVKPVKGGTENLQNESLSKDRPSTALVQSGPQTLPMKDKLKTSDENLGDSATTDEKGSQQKGEKATENLQANNLSKDQPSTTLVQSGPQTLPMKDKFKAVDEPATTNEGDNKEIGETPIIEATKNLQTENLSKNQPSTSLVQSGQHTLPMKDKLKALNEPVDSVTSDEGGSQEIGEKPTTVATENLQTEPPWVQSAPQTLPMKDKLKAFYEHIKDGETADEDGTQKIREKPLDRETPQDRLGNKLFLSKGEARLVNNHHMEGNGRKVFNRKPIMAFTVNKYVSDKKPSDPGTNVPFLFDHFTRLDPGESKYVQLNLMNDPIAKEEFSDSVLYPNQQQQQQQQRQNEQLDDQQEATYFEHKINSGGQLAGQTPTILNKAMTREDNGEARFVAGQVMVDPITKAELTQTLAPEDRLINEESRQNAQIMAAVLNDDDKKVSEANQQENAPVQRRPESESSDNFPAEGFGNVNGQSGSFNLPAANELTNRGSSSNNQDDGTLQRRPETESSDRFSAGGFGNVDGQSGSFNLPKDNELKNRGASSINQDEGTPQRRPATESSDHFSTEDFGNLNSLSGSLSSTKAYEPENRDASSNEQDKVSLQRRPESESSNHSPTEEVGSLDNPSGLLSPPEHNKLNLQDAAKIEAELEGKMLLNPDTVSDISAIDLAPMRHLQALQDPFGADHEPKTFTNSPGVANAKANIVTGNEPYHKIQYRMGRVQEKMTTRPQKKHVIHKKRTDTTQNRVQKHRNSAKLSTAKKVSTPSSGVGSVNEPLNHVVLKTNLTQSRDKSDQPGSKNDEIEQEVTRESDISPSSIIFGLTAKEMKELESHMARKPYGPPALGDTAAEGGNLQELPSVAKGYYDENTEREQPNVPVAFFVNRIIQQRKTNGTAVPVSRKKVHKKSSKRMHLKISKTSAKNFASKSHQTKKTNSNKKRDLDAWDSWHSLPDIPTKVLNSDLDQLRGLSASAQSDISRLMMKDYDKGREQELKLKNIGTSYPYVETKTNSNNKRGLDSWDSWHPSFDKPTKVLNSDLNQLRGLGPSAQADISRLMMKDYDIGREQELKLKNIGTQYPYVDTKANSNSKRGLDSWDSWHSSSEWHPSSDTPTRVLNSDLDQLRGLSPSAAADISRLMMKDFNKGEEQERKLKDIGTQYPYVDNDPGDAYERSITKRSKLKVKRSRDYKGNDSNRSNDGRRKRLFKEHSIRPRNDINAKLYRKGEFPAIGEVNRTTVNYSIPVLIRGNKILNGDVALLDEVKNLDAHDSILTTLRQESEGDMQYVNNLQNHDLDRMKNMFETAGDEVGTKRQTQTHHQPQTSHLRRSKAPKKRDVMNFAGDLNGENKAFGGNANALGAFQAPEVQNQLLHALREENVNELSYVNAMQDMDGQGQKTLQRAPTWINLPSKDEDSFPQALSHEGGTEASYDSNSKTRKHSQEKLKEFLKHARRKTLEKSNTDENYGTQSGTTRDLNAFRDLSPEGKVLSADYNELGNFASDAQNELASVLRKENNGDQRDLKKLEKMDENDERDLDQLFGPFAGPIKRSTAEKPTKRREETIETIADVSDPGSKDKEISIVVSGEDNTQPEFGEEVKKVVEPRPSEWSDWTKCSKSCGEGSMKTRSKYCDENSTTDAIVKCPGWNHQTVPCNVTKNCPVNGGFTQWTEWSECSESCGPKAVRMRMRLCTNPPPTYNGKDCSGWRFQVEYCKEKECPHIQGSSSQTDEHAAKVKPLNKNKQIIFRTLSATPLIEEISSNIPSSSVDRSRERTIPKYDGLRQYVQELGNGQSDRLLGIPEIQRIPTMQHDLDVQQMQIPTLQQLSDTSQVQNGHQEQGLADTAPMQSVHQEEQLPDTPPMQTTHEEQQLSDTPQLQDTHQVEQLADDAPQMQNTHQEQQMLDTPQIQNTHQLEQLLDTPQIHNTPKLPQLTDTPQIQNTPQLQQFSDSTQVQSTPQLQQLTDTPQMPNTHQLQSMRRPTQAMDSMSSMPFLKPEVGSMPQGEEERYENGGKTIHLRGKSEEIGFTPWSTWTSCSASCGRGMRTRTRTCIGSFEATGVDNSCLGARIQTKGCRVRKCPIDGQFTPWSDWSDCSKTCGADSYRKRVRTCTDPPPRYGGEDCEGRSVQRKHCLKAPCPQNNSTTFNMFNISKVFLQEVPPKNASVSSSGGFTEWGPWSQCSKTCGTNSLRVRKRSCYNQFPFGSQNCTGSTTEVKPCLVPPCRDNFDEFLPFSQKVGPAGTINISVKNEFDWSPWSACTQSCGPNSFRTRERTCSLAFSENNGKACIGADIQKIACDVPFCERQQTGKFITAVQQDNTMGQNKPLAGPSPLGIPVVQADPVAQMASSPPLIPAAPPALLTDAVEVAQAALSVPVALTTPQAPPPKAFQVALSRSVPADPAIPVVAATTPALQANAVPGTQAAQSVPAAAAVQLDKAGPGTQAAPSVPAAPAVPQAKAGPGTQAAQSVPVAAAIQQAKASSGTQAAPSVSAAPAIQQAKAGPGTQANQSVPAAAAVQLDKAGPGIQAAPSVPAIAAAQQAKAGPATQATLSVPAAPAVQLAKAGPGTQATPSVAAAPAAQQAKAGSGTQTTPSVTSAPDVQLDNAGPGTQASPSVAAAPAAQQAKAGPGTQTSPSVTTAPAVQQAKAVPGTQVTQSAAVQLNKAGSGTQAAPSVPAVPAVLPVPAPAAAPQVQHTKPVPSVPSAPVAAPVPPHFKSAPPNPNFSDWSAWSKCSATCGPKAVMFRERACKLRGGRKCQGPNIQTKPCPFVRCPVHGGFSPWSQWTHCPMTCGTMALARRQRSCTNPKPMLGGRDCEGEKMQIKNCGREICPVNGGLTGWTEWSTCSKTCNTNTVSIRERYCTNPPPRGRGKDCMGQRMQARACASSKCPVDGGFNSWSKWSECPRCVRGTRKRTRSCTNPPPTNGGRLCQGPPAQEEECPFIRCKTNRGLSSWSAFSRCSRSCGGGIKKRRRRCKKPWRGCYGPRVQRKPCNEQRCPNENYLVRADPVDLCGYNPCKVAKCALDSSAMCVSNSKCKPVFFDTDGKIIESCKGDSVLLAASPEQVCKFNPCKNSACFTNTAERCVVSYNCKPIFLGSDGRRLNCRGILTLPAKDVCGFDPCFEKACKVDLTARCVSDAECKPTFISKTERILDECVDDGEDDSNGEEDEENDHTKRPNMEDSYDDVKNDENEVDEVETEGDSKKDDDNYDNYDEKDEDEYGKRKRKKGHKKDDEGFENDDDERDEDKPRKHRKKLTKQEEDDVDDDSEDDRDSAFKKKDVTPFVNLNVTAMRDKMVSGMGSEISFVSKHGPAKFYWLRRGDKGSKNSTQMLVIEAKGMRKSVVQSPNQVEHQTKRGKQRKD